VKRRGRSPTRLKELYRLKYLVGIQSREEIAKRLNVKPESVRRYEYRLRKKLSQIWDKIPDWKSLLCPECLQPSLWRDPQSGEQVCTNCGYVLESEDLIHRLPFDETYALENRLVFNNSLGGTADKRTVLKVLSRTRNNDWKIKLVAECLKKYSSGEASLIDASKTILEVFMDLGLQQISQAIDEAMEKAQNDPYEAARRIVNRFDAIPIRQIMTLHEMHESPLLRRVKEELETLRKQYGPTAARPYADPDVFSDELGRLAGKVCQAVSSNPNLKFKAKELAAAIFIKTVNLLNPRIIVRYPQAPQEVLKFVEQVQIEELKMRNGNGGE